jgi:hypothetical protein
MPLPPPIPVSRYLVLTTAVRLPAEMERVRLPLVQGLPQQVPLDAEFDLVLYAPLGNAVLLRDASPTALVSSSEPEGMPQLPVPAASQLLIAATQALVGTPARLVVRRVGTVLGALPLAAGVQRALPDDGGPLGARLDIIVLGWALHAGTLRAPGDFGSFIELAWRRVDAGVDRFDLPKLDPRVAAHSQGIIQSELGEGESEELAR